MQNQNDFENKLKIKFENSYKIIDNYWIQHKIKKIISKEYNFELFDCVIGEINENKEIMEMIKNDFENKFKIKFENSKKFFKENKEYIEYYGFHEYIDIPKIEGNEKIYMKALWIMLKLFD